MREIGRREVLTSLFKRSMQEFESQRFQLHQASRWADQAQRDKISWYGELELRNRLFQEDHARECQEIEELRRICCEETDRARQARIDAFSMHRERNASDLEITEQSKFLVRCKSIFTILNPREHLWSDPRSRSSLYCSESRTLPCCDSGLPCDRQNGTDIAGNVFERLLASRRTIFCNLQQNKEFGILLTGIEAWCCRNNKEKRESEMKRESPNTPILFYPTSRVGVAC